MPLNPALNEWGCSLGELVANPAGTIGENSPLRPSIRYPEPPIASVPANSHVEAVGGLELELEPGIDPPQPSASKTTSKKPAIFTVVLIVFNVSSSLHPGLSRKPDGDSGEDDSEARNRSRNRNYSRAISECTGKNRQRFSLKCHLFAINRVLIVVVRALNEAASRSEPCLYPQPLLTTPHTIEVGAFPPGRAPGLLLGSF
jgi:hypothetical protein